jgi:hypothetical protein
MSKLASTEGTRDRALIEGLPRLAWGQGQDCTFAGALAAAMAVTDHPYSYAELMGLSGLAFRVRWSNDETAPRWCPSCAVGEQPYQYQALRALTGWSLPTDVQFGEEKPVTDAIRAKVIASIDTGKPVAAYASPLDIAVVYGYEDGGETLLASDYSQAEEPYRLPSSQIGPMQTYLGAFQEPPPSRDVLIQVLRTASRNWSLGKHSAGTKEREYGYGDAALKAWMRDLDRFDDLDNETKRKLFFLDGWVLSILDDARRAAITFLRVHAPALEENARQALDRAASAYEHEIELLEPVMTLRRDVADVANWSTEARRQEAEVLAEAYQFEAQAMAHIEMARSAMTAEQGEEAMILEGVDRYQVMDPMFESARVVMSYLGETYSPAYIQGISGAAFRIGGICPCAPTCACAMDTQGLLKTFGYEIEHLSLCEEGMDPEKEVQRVIARLKDQIRAGRPALVWHAFTWAEWDVVCGFDDETHQFIGRGSYAGLDGYATAGQGRMATCGAICPPIGAILVGDKTGQYDARRSEIAALREAVAHAHSTQNVDRLGGEQWQMLYGLACYDRWICDFAANPPRLPTMGDRYCFGVNRSTHRAAAGFLRELACKYPQATAYLECAASHFAAEADALNESAEMLFPGWELPQEVNGKTNEKVAALLRTARDNYARGIDEIESALDAMGVPAG